MYKNNWIFSMKKFKSQSGKEKVIPGFAKMITKIQSWF